MLQLTFRRLVIPQDWISIQFDFLQSLETEMYTVAVISSDQIIIPSIVFVSHTPRHTTVDSFDFIVIFSCFCLVCERC